ncbi:Cycloartenol synthase-like protein [uncultured Desulfobacterium sp.]|uniref:Cycloartenol synthase-like protein n=1 Tax=uncultured Desulfobacterium sp. TaxID=201089 RepID=A0A445N0V9_9BACT|nr:Cycloartenol synthase-like protein [uncultured Desulfobacterium sp.]
MKNRCRCINSIIFIFLSIIFLLPIIAFSSEVQVGEPSTERDLSLKLEVRHAIEKGLKWLKETQNPKGYWSQPEYPALSALALTAFMEEPSGAFKSAQQPFIRQGYKYLMDCVKPDGGIYVKDLVNYNTAVSMVALQVSNDPALESTLKKARAFIINQQMDFNDKGKVDSPYDGGIGYGSSYVHSDMSNTMLALESLYYTRYMKQESNTGDSQVKELNWPAVIKFIERCQNLPEYNDQSWASKDPQNKGGFVYFPGESKAGEMDLPSGGKALRSYGSISYAGLLSYIYAEMDKNDPRVKAVFDWLRTNYTVEENPGMGKQGLYYYYHSMAKALSVYGVKELVMADGKKIDWRRDLGLKLLNLQDGSGFWVNENGRWWEKDPNLVTAYAVITLEIIYRGL